MKKRFVNIKIMSFALAVLIFSASFSMLPLYVNAEAVSPFPSTPTQDISPLHGSVVIDIALGEYDNDLNVLYNGKEYKPNFAFVGYYKKGDSSSFHYDVCFAYFVSDCYCSPYNQSAVDFINGSYNFPAQSEYIYHLEFDGIPSSDGIGYIKHVYFDYDSSTGAVSNLYKNNGFYSGFRAQQYRYGTWFAPLYLVGFDMPCVDPWSETTIPFLTKNTTFNWRQPSPITNDLNDLFGGFGNFMEDVDSAPVDDLVGNMGSILAQFGAGVITDKVNENNDTIADLFSGATNHSSVDNGSRGIVEALQASTQAIQAGFNGIAGFLNNFWGNLFSYNVYFFGSVKTMYDNLVSFGLDENNQFSLDKFFQRLIYPDDVDSLISDFIEDSDLESEATLVSSGFDFVTSVYDYFNEYEPEPDGPEITIPAFVFHGITCGPYTIDFEFLSDIKPIYDVVMSAFLIAGYIWFLFTRASGFIRGIPGVAGFINTYTDHTDPVVEIDSLRTGPGESVTTYVRQSGESNSIWHRRL